MKDRSNLRKLKNRFFAAVIILMTVTIINVLHYPVHGDTVDFCDSNKNSEMIKVMTQGNCEYDPRSNSYKFLLCEKINKDTEKQDVYQIIPYTKKAEKKLSDYYHQAMISRISGNHNTVYNSDSAGCVTAHLTIYYSYSTIKGNRYVRLNGINAGYKAGGAAAYVGSNVYVDGNSVVCGQTGKASDGSVETNQRKKYTFSKSLRSFTTTTPSTWKPVTAVYYSNVGANYTITLKRGSGIWKCVVYNNLTF